MNYNENIAKVREMAALHNTGNVGGAANYAVSPAWRKRAKAEARPRMSRGVTTAAVVARRRRKRA